MTDETKTPEDKTDKPVDLFDLPLYQTLNSMNQCLRPLVGDLDMNTLADQLHYTLACDHGDTNSLEALLAAQARTLDTAFHRIVAQSAAGKCFSIENMDMAVKTQRQCRETLKTLRTLQRKQK